MAPDEETTEATPADEEQTGILVAAFDRGDLFRSSDWETGTRYVASALFVLLGAIVAGGLLVAVGTELYATVGITEAGNPVVYHASTTVLNLAGFAVAAGTYLALGRDWSLVRLRGPTRSDAAWTIVGTVLFFIVMAIGSAIIALFDLETAENVAVQRGQEHPELFLVFLPIQFLVTAPAEEFLFRGVIQGLFRRAYGILPGIVFAALLFGLIHYPALAGTDGVVPVIGVLVATGALLGALYEYTGNLLVPIIVHAIWNMFVFGNEYLSAVGVV